MNIYRIRVFVETWVPGLWRGCPIARNIRRCADGMATCRYAPACGRADCGVHDACYVSPDMMTLAALRDVNMR